jgi:hypothetical protein
MNKNWKFTILLLVTLLFTACAQWKNSFFDLSESMDRVDAVSTEIENESTNLLGPSVPPPPPDTFQPK